MSHQMRASAAPGDAVENYAKAIYALQARGDRAVTTTALAQRVGVTAGSVSAMLKKLDRLGLVRHTPYHGVALTDAGERVALAVIRKHRLLETFLVEHLGVPWDEVHRDAEILEHHISDELIERIAEKLDHPARDPHGDPIPSPRGAADDGDSAALGVVPVGTRGTFVRVSDADSALLRHLAELSIAPGAPLEVVERQPFGGATVVRVDGCDHALGPVLADAMRVRPSDPRSRDGAGDEPGQARVPGEAP